MVDPRAAARNFARLAAVGARGPLRLLRGARLHAGARCRRAQTRRDRARLHGAPPGHDASSRIANALLDGAMRARFHAEPIVQATELLLQERTPRDVAVAHPRAEEVEAPRATCASSCRRACGACTSPHDADAAHAPAVQRPLRGDADRRRLGLQPLARSRGHALARGRDPRRLGQLRLPARRRRAARSGRPATSRAASSPTATTSTFAEDRAEIHPARRRRSTTTLEVRRLAGGRRRGAPRVDHAIVGTRAREIELTSYAELVLAPPAADAAHPAFSKLFVQTEFVAELGRAAGDAPAPRAGRAGDLGGASRRRRRRGGRRRRSSRPTARASSAAAASVAHADRGDRRPAAVRTPSARCSIRSSRCAAACGSRPAARRASPSGRSSPPSRERAARPRRQASRRATPSSARRRWPGRRRRCSCATSASTPTRRSLFQRLAGHVALRRPGAAAVAGHDPARRRRRRRRSGRRASPATCRSSCCASTTSRTSASSRQLLRAHEYWRMKRLAVDLVILNERGAVLRPGPADRARDAGADAASRAPQLDGGRRARRGLRAARRSDLAEDARAARSRRRASCSSAGAGTPRRAARPRCREPERAAPPRRAPPASRRRRRCDRAARRRSSSSTASAASPTDGREYVTILGAGQCDAGAVDQRHRQSGVRLPGRRRRRRLHLVA